MESFLIKRVSNSHTTKITLNVAGFRDIAKTRFTRGLPDII